MQRVSTMRAVLHIVTLEPFSCCGARDVEDLGGLAIGQLRVFDLLPSLSEFLCGTGVMT